MRPLDLEAPQAAGLGWPDAIARVLDDPRLVRPVFQPMVDLERGSACGYEMLARFDSPLQAPPPAWLEAAERLGLGARLEALLVEAGLDALRHLPARCFISINVSPRALVSDEVREVLAARTSLERVVFEVTEQAAVDDYADLEHALRTLGAEGASIAVDDAGAGYASLRHIVALRPQFVKVDRALVAHLDTDEAKLAVVDTLRSFATRIGSWLVAEGVERVEELAALQRIGVPIAQGYGLGMPEAAMQPIDPAVSERIVAGRMSIASESRIRALSEPLAAVAAEDGAVAREFSADNGLDFVVVVDDGRHPVALVSRDGGVHSPLCAESAETVVAIARRALARGAAERLDPVVCCDADGRYVGVVRIERLIDALAALAERV